MRSLYIILIACFLAPSCKKYLDIKPQGSTIPSTVTDYDHLLDFGGIIEYYFQDPNQGSMISHLTDNLSLSEGMANVGFVLNNHPNIDHYYAYIYRQPYRNPIAPDYFWSASSLGTYANMKYFNSVIDGINQIPNKSATEDEKGKEVIAQALVARAWAYFNMNMLFGPVYKPGGNNTAKTIPYVTSPDLAEPIPNLSTQEEVFSRVMADIYTALPSIPDAVGWPSRPNKAAAQALLAYCHLFKGNYDSVAYYANLAWTSSGAANPNKVIYDYNKFAFTTPGSPLTSQISAEDNFLNLPNSREMLLYRGTETYAGLSLSYMSDEYISLFDQANDLRFKYFFITGAGYKTTLGGGYDDGSRILSYRTAKSKVTDGITYPELLLMRAEGYARTNKLPEAIADLNTLRRFRYKTGTPALTVGTQDQVINLVLEERRRELPVGGIKRYMDLKRLVNDAGKPWSKKIITHTVGAKSYSGTIDSPDFTLPIVNIILQFNPSWGLPLDTRPFK